MPSFPNHLLRLVRCQCSHHHVTGSYSEVITGSQRTIRPQLVRNSTHPVKRPLPSPQTASPSTLQSTTVLTSSLYFAPNPGPQQLLFSICSSEVSELAVTENNRLQVDEQMETISASECLSPQSGGTSERSGGQRRNQLPSTRQPSSRVPLPRDQPLPPSLSPVRNIMRRTESSTNE